ncbi:cell division protein FtsQ/DivIB [Aquihabitans sp. McL0605]|uniref:cell division protein FtsQ/DivIB n=1 Tax=Aquihabitans sp. McL0605 TaxID=3415671 RepID=UPI003CE9686C
MSSETVFRAGTKPPKQARPAKSTRPGRRTKRPASPSLVDPRLQARRIEVARDQGRRRLRVVSLLVLAVLALAGVAAATQSPLLDVDHLVVHGGSHTADAAARRAIGVRLGEPMVSVDPGAAEARLERLPWVEQASVTRSWPGTVRVAIVERTPVAIAGSGGSAVLVDAHGRSLGPAGTTALPVIEGAPAAAGEVLGSRQRSVAAVLAAMPEALRSEVASAKPSGDGFELVLTDGIVVQWGDDSLPTAKADALVVLLEQAGRSTIDTIDVSVPRATTLTRR